jgi:aspartate aminotransferase
MDQALMLRASSGSSVDNVAVVHQRRAMSSIINPWTDYPMAPLDPIIGLTESFNKDDYPSKVIVGVGAYRDDAGKPYKLPCVRQAEQLLFDKNVDMEYSGIAGDAKFVDLALKFAYGEDSVPLAEKRIGGVQALSGTGGLRVMGELLRKFGKKHIYLPGKTYTITFVTRRPFIFSTH